MTKPFYITTAIDYPNGSPHMGHAYEKIVTDTYHRWYKFLGQESFFLTGTDENGQKLSESAKEAGVKTLDYVDEQVLKFRSLCEDFSISNDDFIRTTEERHEKTAAEFWNNLDAKDFIYKGKYSGNYCLSCEAFYTEVQAPDKICPHHHKELSLREEEGFFFKLSSFQNWIIDKIKSDEHFIRPASARKELLSRLNGDDLRDLAISRPNEDKWGITVPGDDKFVMYTWFDALINYYSAIQTPERKELWPADMHVIGKDIIWFHCVIWPCVLKALDIPLPKQVYVHGMILGSDGRKMSKSMNNGVDPYDMKKIIPVDSFRFYLLRAISSMSDGAFVVDEMIDRHNNELGNDYGNLIMRVLKLSLKIIPEIVVGKNIIQDLSYEDSFKQIKIHMDAREHHKALEVIWENVVRVNQYVNEKEPWKLKEDPAAFTAVVYNCCYALHVLSSLLTPFMPSVTLEALKFIGASSKPTDQIIFGEERYSLSMPTALFEKLEKPAE